MTNEFNMGVSNNSILIDETGNAYTRSGSGVNLPLLYPSAVQRDYLPNMTFTGSRIANGPNFGTSDAPFINYNTTIDITDSVAKVWNRHTSSSASNAAQPEEPDLVRRVRRQLQLRRQLGQSRTTPATASPTRPSGVYNSFTQAANFINGQYRYWNIEFYAQDTWKVNRG